MNTVRIYNKVRRIGPEYLEVGFVDYLVTPEGIEAIHEGVEDFSQERWNKMKIYQVCTWDGAKFNKGGNRWFEYRDDAKFRGRPTDARRAILEGYQSRGVNVAEVQLRRIR